MANSHFFLYIGDWSNGMIGVSKTFGGSSILSSPVLRRSKALDLLGFERFRFWETKTADFSWWLLRLIKEHYLIDRRNYQLFVRKISSWSKHSLYLSWSEKNGTAHHSVKGRFIAEYGWSEESRKTCGHDGLCTVIVWDYRLFTIFFSMAQGGSADIKTFANIPVSIILGIILGAIES